MNIPFNQPYLTGKETDYILRATESGKLSGNGMFTAKCQQFFEKRYGFEKCFLTTSCTTALEMAALLLNIQPGDEVIMPSYTYVTTANAFALRGAKIVFADSLADHPNIDLDKVEALITEKTKALLLMHYGGFACDMDKAKAITEKHQIELVEDAAHCVNSYYGEEVLGSIGSLGAMSFHETKNIISGEGGMLMVNDDELTKRAEVIWDKGTNRAAFTRGETDQYEWMDLGSSFFPSEITAAFLYAQLEQLEDIQQKRIKIWKSYERQLKSLAEEGCFSLPKIPGFATKNGHLFYLACHNKKERDDLITYLNSNGVNAVFHYLPLHASPYYKDKHDGRELPNAQKFADCLLRLPLFYELQESEVDFVCEQVQDFFRSAH